MKRSELVDYGYDYDYEVTIRMGDEYDSYGYDYADDAYDLEQGFDPYEGDYTYDC